MPFILKLFLSTLIIITATQIGRYFPSLSGLIATMPLTGAIVLVWLYSDNPGDFQAIENYTKGALLGILPSILFFITALFCFRRELTLSLTLTISFSVWLLGAFLHQLLMK